MRNFGANIQSYVIMNWKILNQPLGTMGSLDAPTKKEWIVSAALAAGALASSIFGGASSRKAAKEAQRQQEAEKAQLEAERLRAKNQSWTDTKSGQNTIRILQQQADRAVKRMQGAAVVAGGTDASVAQEKELQNQKQAEVIAQAVANHEDKVDANDAAYRAEIAHVNQGIQQSKMAQADATAQVAGGVSNALAQGAMASAAGKSWFNKGSKPATTGGTGSPGGGGVEVPKQLPTYYNRYKVLNPYIHSYLTGMGTT